MSLAGPFLFDPRAFWGDENVRRMTEREVVAYLRLLSHQWEEGSIPNDFEEIAFILTEGPRRYTEEDLRGPYDVSEGRPSDLESYPKAKVKGSLWGSLRSCFIVAASDKSRLMNPRLARERKEWLEKKRRQSEGGRKGGKAKKTKGLGRGKRAQGKLEATPESNLQLSHKDTGKGTSSISVSPSIEEKTPLGSAAGPPEKLNSQAAKVDQMAKVYEEHDVTHPGFPLLGLWLKNLGGDAATGVAFLMDMAARGKLGNKSYVGTCSTDWQLPQKRRPRRSGNSSIDVGGYEQQMRQAFTGGDA